MGSVGYWFTNYASFDYQGSDQASFDIQIKIRRMDRTISKSGNANGITIVKLELI